MHTLYFIRLGSESLKFKNNLTIVQGSSFFKIFGHSSYNGIFRLTVLHFRLTEHSIYYSVLLLICFMINYDSNKDLNLFLSFPDQTTHLTLKNNFKNNLKLKTRKILKY